MKRTDSGRQLIAVVFALAMLFLSADARAELLPSEQLQQCDVHVVGIYSPKDHHLDDRVQVQVQDSGRPIVLVLCGYYGAQWQVEVTPDADLKQVIVAGYFEHSIVGVDKDVPVEFITYFPKGETSRKDYFWAHSWNTKYGRETRARLRDITGSDVATFQGEYSGEQFVVDGQRGKIDAADLSPSSASRLIAKPQSKVDQYRDLHQESRLKRERFIQSYGPKHPSVKQIESTMELIRRELERLGADLSEINESPEVPDEANDAPAAKVNSREVIRQLVKQSFELQTELQEARIAKAEADLKRIKLQLEQRKNAASQIIADRVDELVQQDETEKQDELADASAAVLASEGWVAWRKHDLRTALERFKDATEKEPANDSALNGLGWTYVHLRKYDEAIVQFKQLLKDQPTHPGAMNGLGQSLLAQGKLDEAEKELLKATEDAIAALGEAKTVQRGVTASWIGLVRTYIQKNDLNSANVWIERYLKHQPENTMILRLKAEVEAENKSELEADENPAAAAVEEEPVKSNPVLK